MNSTECEIVIIGGGPGGYAAAFYAADLGKQVTLIERDDHLGGVCMNRGCIPSKALLHAIHGIVAARESAKRGISFGEPSIELSKLRDWKNGILTKLAGGLKLLASKRGVKVVHGRGYLEDSNTVRVETESGQQFIKFQRAIVAVGSRPALPKIFDLGNPRVMTSTEALELEEIPKNLLVIGGGYIGMELGTVYATLGSQVTVVEALDSILMGADADLVRPVMHYAKKAFKEIRFKSKVTGMSTAGKKIKVTTEFDGQSLEELYDRVLVSVGRTPNSSDLGLENTKVQLDDHGFVKVDKDQRTNDPNIYAIGDIVGGLMLAHKASREARISVEAIIGEPGGAAASVLIPAVVFTDPEVAWCGLTETEAKEQGIPVKVSKFPWGANGRALTYDRVDGLTKLIVDPGTDRILGVGIVGHGAGELISEGAVAVEMGATARDLALIVHPHPTLSETIMEAAEAFYGHATHTITSSE